MFLFDWLVAWSGAPRYDTAPLGSDVVEQAGVASFLKEPRWGAGTVGNFSAQLRHDVATAFSGCL